MHSTFNLEKATLLLKVEGITIPPNIETYAKEHGMTIKKEFHITVLGFNMGKKIIESMDQQGLSMIQKTHVLNHLSDIAQNSQWGYELNDEYFHLYKTYPNNVRRESIIQLIKLTGHELFLKKIEDFFKMKISLFPHISIYAKTSNPEEIPIMGIGVQDLSEFLNTQKTIIKI